MSHEKTQEGKKEFRLIDGLKIFFLALMVAFLTTQFVMNSTLVEGSSMADTLHSGDRLLVMKLGTSINRLKRGDIVVFDAPGEEKLYIKRVIAFPNEYVQIEDGLVYINGKRLDEPYISTAYTYTSGPKEWYIQEGELFVLGDNRQRGASKDSRVFGPIKAEALEGHAIFRYFPLDHMGTF